MSVKSVSSTQAQNNFGQVLDDIIHNHTRYVVERRGAPKAVILSFDDFAKLLNDTKERQEMGSIIRELQPEYGVGQVVDIKNRAR